MSNSYFQFKEFSIEQDQCAMKVSTDACIQGAWTPVDDTVRTVLDIGAGTGLLSLMLAQRYPQINITGIELDEAAAEQAAANTASSPWGDRIKMIQADANTYAPAQQYDMVIGNPPFFQNSLLGPDAERNKARHTHSLEYRELLACMDRALKPSGYASVLLPVTAHSTWKNIVEQSGWGVLKELHIRPNNRKGVNRVVSLCSRNANVVPETEQLCIYEQQAVYTEALIKLLQPFYLNL